VSWQPKLRNTRVELAILATLFDRLGRYESAATIAGFAFPSHYRNVVP
jgi:hypothetical protein